MSISFAVSNTLYEFVYFARDISISQFTSKSLMAAKKCEPLHLTQRNS